MRQQIIEAMELIAQSNPALFDLVRPYFPKMLLAGPRVPLRQRLRMGYLLYQIQMVMARLAKPCEIYGRISIEAGQ